MSALSDRDLIAAAVRGEVGAFATLASRYRDVHTRFAIRMLGGYDAADEALQAAFVRASQTLNRCKAPDQFADWLFRLVINECRARALRRVVRARATGEMEAITATPRPGANDADGMQRVVDQIDPAIREPFILLYVEELPYARIALLTGVAVQTLERQVDRACARLREIMPTTASDTQLSSAGMLLSGDPTPSLAVQVATPLRRTEVLNESFEDRLMGKLLRPGAGDARATGEMAAVPARAGATEVVSSPAPLPPSPWTMHNDSGPVHSRRAYLALAGIGGCLCLAAFLTGYAARRWRDVRDVERRRPTRSAAAPKIVRRTDTLRVVRSDTVVLARFAFADDAAHAVSLIGDFNDWNPSAAPLLPGLSRGSWSTTVSLPPGRYEYAFLVDGKRWAVDRFSRATHEESGVQSSVVTFGADAALPGDASSARARIRKLLPRDVGERILTRIAAGKDQGLPAGALEQRTLELSARRMPAKDIERAIIGDADRLSHVRRLLGTTAHASSSTAELIAGAEALRRGSDTSSIVALARAVPIRRNVAVPLQILAQLVGGGMNAEEAVDKIRTRVQNDAPDAALERWADETAVKLASRAAEKGKTTKVAKGARKTTEIRQAGSPSTSEAHRKKSAAPSHHP
jgi:RNA polymerase sigma factor (sigma-70 family)